MKRVFGMLAATALFPMVASAAPLHPKIVIIGYFETSREFGQQGYWGESRRPGELYNWIKGFNLNRQLPVEGAFNGVWANSDASVIAMKIGPNSLSPAVNITALGLDRKFDLSHAYWLITGIAGTSPNTDTIGDVIWTDFIVNGDVAHEIDAREIPADWPEGYFPAGQKKPDTDRTDKSDKKIDVSSWDDSFHMNRTRTVFQLNTSLMRWAKTITSHVHLPDTEEMNRIRLEYNQKQARSKPAIVTGATLSAETFWLGARLDSWARHWTDYMTAGRSEFRSTETNDAGTITALSALAQAGHVDPNRIMLLRGASNFDMPPPTVPAAEQLVHEGPQSFAGYQPALDGIFSVGSLVVRQILSDWPRYELQIPSK